MNVAQTPWWQDDTPLHDRVRKLKKRNLLLGTFAAGLVGLSWVLVLSLGAINKELCVLIIIILITTIGIGGYAAMIANARTGIIKTSIRLYEQALENEENAIQGGR